MEDERSGGPTSGRRRNGADRVTTAVDRPADARGLVANIRRPRCLAAFTAMSASTTSSSWRYALVRRNRHHAVRRARSTKSAPGRGKCATTRSEPLRQGGREGRKLARRHLAEAAAVGQKSHRKYRARRVPGVPRPSRRVPPPGRVGRPGSGGANGCVPRHRCHVRRSMAHRSKSSRKP